MHVLYCIVLSNARNMFFQSLWHVLHQCTGCTANGSVGMIEIPISHRMNPCVVRFLTLLTDFIPLDMSNDAVGCQIDSNQKHIVPGTCRESCLRLRRARPLEVLRSLCPLKPRHRVDHLSCIGKAFHNMDSIDQAIACHRLSFVTWHASFVWLNVEAIM